MFRKRKNDEIFYPEEHTPRHRTAVIRERIEVGFVGVGLILLMLITIGGTLEWFVTSNGATYAATDVVRTNTNASIASATALYNATQYGMHANDLSLDQALQSGRMPVSLQGKYAALTPDGRVYVSTWNDGQGAWLSDNAQEIALAPNGMALAYINNGKLILSYGSGTYPIAENAHFPAWGADGQSLYYVQTNGGGDVLFKVSINMLTATLPDDSTPIMSPILNATQITAPPVANPATGRLLIVDRLTSEQSQVFTVDPAQCFTIGSCMATRKDVFSVPEVITGISYHASATRLVYTSLANGIVLYQVGSHKATSIAPYRSARNPVFVPDSASDLIFSADNSTGSYAGMLTTASELGGTTNAMGLQLLEISWAGQ